MSPTSAVTVESVAAVCIGLGWGGIVFGYEGVKRTAIFRTLESADRSRWYVTREILFIGGGTGVMLYLTDTILSSFVFGLVGLSLVVVTVTLARYLRA